jgi:Holliday junction resolvase RusA-like endonuclease
VNPRELRFTVIGLPAPKGSTRSFVITPKGGGKPRAVTTGDNPKTKGWQHLIASCASMELLRPENAEFFLREGAVECEATFYLPRPKTLLTKRTAGQNVPHTKRPDIDKLARSFFDSLSRVVWSDDAQVTSLIAKKRYCAAGESPRADIIVRRAPLEDLFGNYILDSLCY